MKQLFILMLLGSFMFGCSENANTEVVTVDSVPATTTVEHSEEAGDAHHEHINENIELNDGKKWKVNNEMKPYIAKSEQLLAEYKASDSRNHQQLAEKLSKENDALIASCTMKGRSHDELHKWLHPHLKLVKQLKEVSEAAHVDAIVANLETSFKDFHQYFE